MSAIDKVGLGVVLQAVGHGEFATTVDEMGVERCILLMTSIIDQETLVQPARKAVWSGRS